MSKYYLIVNPHGGGKKGLAVLEKVKPIFDAAGAVLDVKETRYGGHARIFANTLDFAGYDGLCAIGGDELLIQIMENIVADC